MDFLSKKMQKFSMKASGMSDEAIRDMERQQEEAERAMKQGGPTAAQDAYMKRMEDMMKKQANANASGTGMSIADELAKLAKLKEQGVISDSEFQQMKQELIKRMS
ncbi:MAG TPA: SHOCT domain-containing protein [Nitrososphaera sp.]|nr:SHOCT domain-containing protein [Nitrososphaera sp.]